MQSFMSIHITNNNCNCKLPQAIIVVVYKLVNLICRCGVTVVVLSERR